ncbi:MAG: NAD(P)/FAD-dependent oxidoreductase [Alphaproteobacteria bacterium]|nr:NAD(P)/FAD-dependent oxidoreductase [Alphaproteobacteria bacterium]
MSSAYDVVVVGAGHNGLVTAAYLGKAGLRVLVLERGPAFGGPCATREFIPGYRCSLANSPGSFERRVMEELELPDNGLSFATCDPSLVHFLEDRVYVNWQDAERNRATFETFASGEWDRQKTFVAGLEELAAVLGVSIFETPPPMSQIYAAAADAGMEHRLNAVLFGSLRELLDEALESEEAKTLLGMVALNANLVPPSSAGSGIGLMMRPLSLASSPLVQGNDFRRYTLRGSTGLPIGGMGAVIDALVNVCRTYGVQLRTDSEVAALRGHDGAVTTVVLESGEEIRASRVVSAISPKLLFRDLLDDELVEPETRRRISGLSVRGSAFKIVLGLDGLPEYRDLPPGITQEAALTCQFRIAHSLGYIEDSVLDGLRGRPAEGPIMWGLFPSITSPQLAPPGRYLLSVNVWHAPYRLASGTWDESREAFGWHCVEVMSRHMSGLKERIVEHSFTAPDGIEDMFNLVESNITHGDMLPGRLFAARPDRAIVGYRAPVKNLYLTGAGVWPGGYVTGIPGRNTSEAVLADISSQEG